MKKAVSVVLINAEGLVLAVSRKDDHNDMSLIGGKVDPEDNDDVVAAAIRETKEETGLDIYDLELVYAAHSSGVMGYTFLAKCKEGIIQTDEPHIVKWTGFAEIMAGSFGDWNTEVARSLYNMGVTFEF